MSWTLIKYVIKAAIRDRLVIALLALIGVSASLSVFMGSAAVSESDQFAAVFAAGSLRFAGVVGLVLFAVFHIRRSFDTKDVEYLLSRPISRVTFLFSHAAAFSLLALVMALVVSAAVALISFHNFGTGHFLWSFSLIAEFIIMINIALFFAMVLPGAASGALAVFGFYVLARLMGQLLGIVDTGLDMSGFAFLSIIFQGISMIIPRLDLMAQTSWLIYEPDGSVGYFFIAGQCVIYTSLILIAALVDLVRRQF